MRILLAVALLGAPTAASTDSDAWPPSRFTANSSIAVTFVDPVAVDRACGTHGRGKVFTACNRSGRLIMPNPCGFPEGDFYARIACHELAHRNGWSAAHEQ